MTESELDSKIKSMKERKAEAVEPAGAYPHQYELERRLQHQLKLQQKLNRALDFVFFRSR